MLPQPGRQGLVTLGGVVERQIVWTSIDCRVELVLASVDAGADHAMFAHLPRPFLAMRTHGSVNHPGPDEEPIGDLATKAALVAPVGSDPNPIGGPAWAATQAGPFLSERPHPRLPC